jgi:hypothetical protein
MTLTEILSEWIKPLVLIPIMLFLAHMGLKKLSSLSTKLQELTEEINDFRNECRKLRAQAHNTKD